MEDKKKDHKKRLRKRFQEEGLNGFHDYEVLELLLSYSLIYKDTKDLAKDLIQQFGSISQVMNASVKELEGIKGMSTRTAVLLKIVRESGVFMMKDKVLGRHHIKSSEDIQNYLKYYYKAEKVETFLAFYLNVKNMIIAIEPLFKGTVNEAKVYLRTVVESSLKHGASAVIVVHNHPSGSMDVSSEDIKLTRKLKEILKIIDVRLLDHIIVADDECLSMNNNRLM